MFKVLLKSNSASGRQEVLHSLSYQAEDGDIWSSAGTSLELNEQQLEDLVKRVILDQRAEAASENEDEIQRFLDLHKVSIISTRTALDSQHS